MKKYIIKLVLISLIPILLVVAFDFWLRNQNSLYAEKYNGLIDKKDSVQVLILGNSHANYALDPSEFTHYFAYNLANVSQKIYFDKRLTLKAIENGISKLQYVFISIDYHSLHTSTQGIRNYWSYYANGIKYKNDKYLLSNVSPFLWGYTPKVSIAMFRKKIINRIKYYNTNTINFDVENGVKLTDSINRGFIGFTGTDPSNFNPSWYETRAKSFDEPLHSEREEIIIDLEDFISKLIDQGIKPILISSPTYYEYNRYLNPSLLEKNENDIKLLCNKFELVYWNYMNDKQFQKRDFYNCDHLNKEGARKFSTILSNRLDKYSESLDSLK